MDAKIEKQMSEIRKLKKERNAVILAHNYQRAEVQEVADYTGDSLGLSRIAAKVDEPVIVFCGVSFMAETAKLLSPDKTVLLPDINAGCPLANMLTVRELRALKQKHPNAVVVTYVNSSAAVKAESDYCCTSANASTVVAAVPEDREIIFAPDKNLGRWAEKQTGRKMIIWQGFCPTHQKIRLSDVEQKRKEFPDAKIVVHPECAEDVCDAADFVGSTSAMVRFAEETDARQIVVGTEIGMLHPLRKAGPDKEFIPLSELADCPNMKLVTLEKIIWSLEDMVEKIDVPADIAAKANKAIRRMVELG